MTAALSWPFVTAFAAFVTYLVHAAYTFIDKKWIRKESPFEEIMAVARRDQPSPSPLSPPSSLAPTLPGFPGTTCALECVSGPLARVLTPRVPAPLPRVLSC